MSNKLNYSLTNSISGQKIEPHKLSLYNNFIVLARITKIGLVGTPQNYQRITLSIFGITIFWSRGSYSSGSVYRIAIVDPIPVIFFREGLGVAMKRLEGMELEVLQVEGVVSSELGWWQVQRTTEEGASQSGLELVRGLPLVFLAR